MSACIWYVSKYVTLPSTGRVGTRPFMIMRELVGMGHRCLILTSDSSHLATCPDLKGRPYLTSIADGVELCWIRTLKYQGAKSFRRILSWLDFEWQLWRVPKDEFPRPDVVIVSSLSLLTILNGLLMRRRYGCRLIFEVRDIWPLTIVEEGGFSRYNPFVVALAIVERLAYRRADVLVGTMPNLQQHVVEVLGRSRPVHCIPMGVDESMIGKAQALPQQYDATHIPWDKFLVCYTGAIGISNALDTLLTCAREMRDRPEIHFLIVGEGGLRSHYQAMCADLPNVSFPPVVPQDMVQSLLARCDLLYFAVHPSKVWNYGQSLNKVIDYMLAGKPIVASYTGFPSMINEAKCGSFVPAGDAEALRNEIVRYADMPADARATIGAAGRTWLLNNRRYRGLAEEYLRLAIGNEEGSNSSAPI